MKFYQQWTGCRIQKGKKGASFPVQVPGNIQYDYGAWHQFGDVNFNCNCEKYRELENDSWLYETKLQLEKKEGERIFFVSEGIDYESDILLDGVVLHHQEGMFTKIELDITDSVKKDSILQVFIYPHPKRPGVQEDRTQADHCCKPPVGYGWDWHPRLLTSGIWNDTYLETRDEKWIEKCEPFYTLDEDLKGAAVHFEIETGADFTIEVKDQEGNLVYQGSNPDFRLEDIQLWWCNGQGRPYLYHWRIYTESDEKRGTIGFRKVRLILNEGTEYEGEDFPKTRRMPPMTIELNGRRIFAKGSNWVNPEIFNGMITKDTYEPLVRRAFEANMNILRAWGGAAVDKEPFFDLCDEMGILVWQEFPLACNCYPDEEHYLTILEQEAVSIVTRLRRHPCVALWSGGNELFNSWSGMTDQSHPLRLLNKICYEQDRNTPFIMTSPVMGAGHGGYLFYMPYQKQDVYEIFTNSRCTAYPEFGVPSISEADYLRQILPEDELFPVRPTKGWILHHGFGAWGDNMLPDAWAAVTQVEQFFGKMDSLDELVKHGRLMQAQGYKAIFEEARRQKPHCSMALNWCYNHPWKVAAGESLLLYPAVPTQAYFAVAASLRNTLASARIGKFSWKEGEMFHAQLWLLSDAPHQTEDVISAWLEIDGKEEFLLEWKTGIVPGNTNKMGPEINVVLPSGEKDTFLLRLKSENGYDSEYELCYQKRQTAERKRGMNL